MLYVDASLTGARGGVKDPTEEQQEEEEKGDDDDEEEYDEEDRRSAFSAGRTQSIVGEDQRVGVSQHQPIGFDSMFVNIGEDFNVTEGT